MSAQETIGNDTSGLTMTIRASGQKPKYKKTAAALLGRCREFYQDPENERAYQEWKAGRMNRNDERSCG